MCRMNGRIPVVQPAEAVMAVTGCVAAVPSANRVAPMPPVMLIREPHIEKTEKDRLEDMRTVVEHDDAGLEVKSMLDAAGHVARELPAVPIMILLTSELIITPSNRVAK